MDKPTTTAPTGDTGADLLIEAQPEQPAEPAAATTPSEPDLSTETTTEPSEEQPAAPTDDNLEWLKAKGIDPSDPEAVRKVADMYRNAEKAMHQSTAKASELEKSLKQDVALPDPGSPDAVQQLAQQVQNLTVANQVSEFFNDPQKGAERKALEPVMAQIVTENPTIGELVKSGYMSYDQLFAMAKGSDPSREQQLKADGGREALEQVASKQQARAVVGNATTGDLSPPADDPFLAGFNNV